MAPRWDLKGRRDKSQIIRLLGVTLVPIFVVLALSLGSLQAQDLAWKIVMDTAARATQEQRYQDAEESYHRALELALLPSGKEQPYAATTFNDLAVLYYNQQKFDQAERYYLEALALSEQDPGPNPEILAITRNNLASLYCSEGKLEKSRALFERSLALATAKFGPESEATLAPLQGLGEIAIQEHQIARAKELYASAASLGQKILPSESPQLAQWLHLSFPCPMGCGRRYTAIP